ncbi:MAG TPA: acetyl ornithine aminotransferase family protein [Candidatus Polarisedimenticolia bacterium]|nr:acetyl ornithine aminotransferase family protein [Candidatus Polarisedimenticolia bacterium]
MATRSRSAGSRKMTGKKAPPGRGGAVPPDEGPEIRGPLPGPRARALLERDRKVMSPYNRPFYYPAVVESAKDCLVTDIDGNRFIDFNSGLGVMNVGHGHPRVLAAIKAQIERLQHYSYTDFNYRYAVELAERLTGITPGTFAKKVFFGGSGAESVEAAIKLTRWHTRKPQFIAFLGAFHGRTMGALSLTASSPVQKERFAPTMPGVVHVPFGNCYRCPFKLTYPSCDLWCVDYIEKEVLGRAVPASEVAALFVEPIQGEGGYVVPPPDYHQRLKALCERHEILYVADEVQSGMGRTGRWLAIEHWGVTPDAVCLSKAIASGVSLGAVVGRADLFDWQAGSHCTTLGGSPVACEASLATLSIIEEEGLLKNARTQGEHILARLRAEQPRFRSVGDVRGKGLMCGVEIVKDRDSKEADGKAAKRIITRAWKKGLLAITAGDSTLRIAPPLTITRDLVDRALDMLLESIDEEEHGRPL